MKTVRIEIKVTAIVHIGEGLTEDDPPPNTPWRAETMEVRRIVVLGHTFAADVGNAYETTKAHTFSAMAGLAGVLPDKLGHAARELTS